VFFLKIKNGKNQTKFWLGNGISHLDEFKGRYPNENHSKPRLSKGVYFKNGDC